MVGLAIATNPFPLHLGAAAEEPLQRERHRREPWESPGEAAESQPTYRVVTRIVERQYGEAVRLIQDER
jgi:hypothetical protein